MIIDNLFLMRIIINRSMISQLWELAQTLVLKVAALG